MSKDLIEENTPEAEEKKDYLSSENRLKTNADSTTQSDEVKTVSDKKTQIRDGENVTEVSNSTEIRTQSTQTDEYKGGRIYFYVALGCFILGFVLLVLSFVVGQSGTTLLFISMLAQLVSVSFLNAQKRREEFTACKILRYLSYAAMIAAIAIVLIGISVITGNKGE